MKDVFDPRMTRRHVAATNKGSLGETLARCGAPGRMLVTDDATEAVPLCPLCGGPPLNERTPREKTARELEAFPGSETWA